MRNKNNVKLPISMPSCPLLQTRYEDAQPQPQAQAQAGEKKGPQFIV